MSTFNAALVRQAALLCVVAASCLAGGLPQTAQASTISAIFRGSTDDMLASASPGTAIDLNFRSNAGGSPTDAQPPVYAISMLVQFQTRPAPSAFKLQLSTGDIYTIPFGNELNLDRGSFVWYDPNFFDPNLIEPAHEVIPEAWRREMSDGVLNAHVWAEGTSIDGAPDFYLFQAGLQHIKFDLADLRSLGAHYGTSAGADFSDGDIDSDGDVDLNDLGTLATYYGGGQAQAYADFQTIMPEPTCLLIIPCAGLLIARWPHRRRVMSGAASEPDSPLWR
jgi:hypothetical protein